MEEALIRATDQRGDQLHYAANILSPAEHEEIVRRFRL
jgi:hypothetical protein